MTEIGPHLERLGLGQYLDAFVGEGFDTWETLLDIQESDFDALNVKLGHRRKLQRAIAEYRGIPYERLFASSAHETGSDIAKASDPSQPSAPGGGTGAPAPAEKRKYRRHPKPDENAPERPPSAYVIFSNKVREEVKDQNLSFTQIAKLVGDKWQKLDPAGKEPYEVQANAAKERYNIQLSTYKKTDAHKEYQQYLADFKAKHGTSGTGATEQKRPRLEPESSAGSLSGKSGDVAPDLAPPVHGHVRGGSTGSMSSAPYTVTPTSPARGQSLSLQTQPGAPSSNAPLAPRNLPGSAHGSTPPPPAGRELRWRGSVPQVGPLSTQSSVSEGSSVVRSDSDPLVRTASLSLSTPPSGTPPLPPLSQSTASEHGQSQDFGRARFSSQYQQHGSGHASGTFPQTLPSPVGSEGSWRSRPADLRGYMDMGSSMQPPSYPTSSQQQSVGISLPPLVPGERSEFQQRMTLPLPRTSPTQQPGYIQTSRFGDGHNPFSFNQAQRQARPSSSAESPLERSESDAANTLAGLASGATSTSRPSSTQPPEQTRWPRR